MLKNHQKVMQKFATCNTLVNFEKDVKEFLPSQCKSQFMYIKPLKLYIERKYGLAWHRFEDDSKTTIKKYIFKIR